MGHSVRRNKPTRPAIIPALAILVLTFLPGPAAERAAAKMEPPAAPAARSLSLDGSFGRMPVTFIANRGQLDRRVDYYLAGRDASFYFGSGGLTIALNPSGPKGGRDRRDLAGGPNGIVAAAEADGSRRWVLKLDFIGARPGVRPIGETITGTVYSYFKGRPEDWRTGIPSYSRLIYRDLWPGIDLVYSGTANKLKYEFIVRPGADPSVIKLSYRGASALGVGGAGELEVETPAGGFRDDRPVAYQNRGGARVSVAVAYRLGEDARADGPSAEREACPPSSSKAYGFDVGAYDASLPLVLDPATIIYCGFLGGSAGDRGAAIAIDESGSAYVTGSTASYDFPVAAGPDPTFNSQGVATDAFVAKVSPDGSTLLYCGFIGGSLEDAGTGIAVHVSGDAYVCGWTFSPDFPAVVGPGQVPHGDISVHSDAFVARLSADGTSLEYCGFLGGTGDDRAMGIAVDGSRNVYLTGWTGSSDFPTAGGSGSIFMGETDAFVAIVNWQGTGFYFSMLLGGLRQDVGTGIGIDCCGAMYITGYTESSPADGFPASPGPPLSYGGGRDAFVAKIGETLEACWYIGGEGTDEGLGIAVDYFGPVYVVGTSDSGQGFPVKTGPGLVHHGGNDAFLAKIDMGPYKTTLYYCGFIGGAGDDRGLAVAADSEGRVFLAGSTDGAPDFPVRGGPSLVPAGLRDAFLAEVNFKGEPVLYCGYLGGSGNDEAAGLAVDEAGNVFLAGATRSPDFPAVVGPDLILGAGLAGEPDDAFVARVFLEPPPTSPGEGKATALSTSEITVTWGDRSTNETGFKVSRAEGHWTSLDSFQVIGTVGADVTTFTDTGLTEATSYTYSIQAFNDTGDSPYSVIATQFTWPLAPTNLAATAVNERRIDLTWTNTAHAQDKVLVLRQWAQGGAWEIVGSAPGLSTSYSDSYFMSGDHTYNYCLKASIGDSLSVQSAEASATTPPDTLPAAPTNLRATVTAYNQVELTWVDNAYNEKWSDIERKAGTVGQWFQVGTVNTNWTIWTDTKVEEGGAYTYRVRGYNAAGYSDYSNEAQVTLPLQVLLRYPIRGVDFGSVDECTWKPATTVLYNDGRVDLVVTGIVPSSGPRSFNYIAPPVPFVVPPGWGQEILFRFSPTAPTTGTLTAVFTVFSNDPVNGAAPLQVTGSSKIPFESIDLRAQRVVERAWLVRREFARIDLTIGTSSPYADVSYRLLRRAGPAPYQTVKSFVWDNTSSGAWTYADYFLDAGTDYGYKVQAVDCRGVVISESQEAALAASAAKPAAKSSRPPVKR